MTVYEKMGQLTELIVFRDGQKYSVACERRVLPLLHVLNTILTKSLTGQLETLDPFAKSQNRRLSLYGHRNTAMLCGRTHGVQNGKDVWLCIKTSVTLETPAKAKI